VRTIRISNVAPRVTSTPPTEVSIDQSIVYRLAIDEPGGSEDPLIFRMTRSPIGATLSDDQVFRWQPGPSDVTSGGRPPIPVRIEIDDGDGGVTAHEWQMEVSENHAPSQPVPLYPISNLPTLETQPRLSAQNGGDLDGDTLLYHFEIDRVATFDSPELQRSGEIEQTPGFTSWVPTTPLGVGQWHWRVMTTDGEAPTEWAEATFLVVPDPSMIPDGGPPGDGGVAVDGGGVPPVETPRGCSCRAAGAGRGTTAWPSASLAGLVLLGLVLRSRVVRTRRRG
jgi:hypothetical protein